MSPGRKAASEQGFGESMIDVVDEWGGKFHTPSKKTPAKVEPTWGEILRASLTPEAELRRSFVVTMAVIRCAAVLRRRVWEGPPKAQGGATLGLSALPPRTPPLPWHAGLQASFRGRQARRRASAQRQKAAAETWTYALLVLSQWIGCGKCLRDGP